ncbi:MarR family transcriptional regulator [Enterococcus sp. MJM16]|uniref:MarR family transcriptional regulator n=1 Tax=Candidatus Enterococcus murrayae TaxID=2815321 RepID=A0ABS3HHA3_9ENTE|nr:MarR family transcriptional regulator [Enterococcus sp. MJM16]MBO0452295.1 MarR family transcriptional regulator [Enterococcus sp. MJM16]
MSNLKSALIQLQCELVAERNLVNPNELSWLQYDILNLLRQKGPSSPSLLAEQLHIRPSKFSKAIKTLKEKGYVIQTVNQQDGRGLLTSLSSAGRTFLDSVDAGHTYLYETADAVLSTEEKTLFTQCANKLIRAFEEERMRKHVPNN